MPKLVFALGLTEDVLATIGEAVGQGSVRPFAAVREVEAQLLVTADVSVVANIPGEKHTKACEALVELRRRFPHVPMVVIYNLTVSAPRAVLQLGEAGVKQIVTGAPRVQRDDLVRALSDSHGDGAARRLWRHCDFTLPEPLTPLLKAAIRLAHAPISAESLADATRMHERTLRKYCTQHRLPSPQWIIGWARLLIAGFYLDEPGRTMVQVAEMLEFPSSCALRNQMKRYTGTTSRSMREGSASLALARTLERSMNCSAAEILASALKAVDQSSGENAPDPT